MGEPAAGVTPAVALERFFDHYYRRHPVTATFTGVHDYDHRLPDWSPEGLASAADEMRELRATLQAAGRVPDAEVRSYPEQVDLALADAFLEIQLAEHAGGHFHRSNPALWTGEAIFSVLSLVTRDFAPLAERLDRAAARVAALPAFLDGARGTLRSAPAAWRERALRECDAAERLFGDNGPYRRLELSRGLAPLRQFLLQDLPPAGPGAERAGRDLLSLLLTRGHWCATPID